MQEKVDRKNFSQRCQPESVNSALYCQESVIHIPNNFYWHYYISFKHSIDRK